MCRHEYEISVNIIYNICEWGSRCVMTFYILNIMISSWHIMVSHIILMCQWWWHRKWDERNEHHRLPCPRQQTCNIWVVSWCLDSWKMVAGQMTNEWRQWNCNITENAPAKAFEEGKEWRRLWRTTSKWKGAAETKCIWKLVNTSSEHVIMVYDYGVCVCIGHLI